LGLTVLDVTVKLKSQSLFFNLYIYIHPYVVIPPCIIVARAWWKLNEHKPGTCSCNIHDNKV